MCETSAIVLAYLFGERPVFTVAIRANDITNIGIGTVTLSETKTRTKTVAAPRRCEVRGDRCIDMYDNE